MAKSWRLDTETKGTGANVVPVDAGAKPRKKSDDEPLFAPQRRPQRAKAPPPPPSAARPPRRFKVVDVLNGRALLEDGDTRAAVETLGGLRSPVDARVFLFSDQAQTWRLLTAEERRALWDLRGRVAVRPTSGSAARRPPGPARASGS